MRVLEREGERAHCEKVARRVVARSDRSASVRLGAEAGDVGEECLRTLGAKREANHLLSGLEASVLAQDLAKPLFGLGAREA